MAFYAHLGDAGQPTETNALDYAQGIHPPLWTDPNAVPGTMFQPPAVSPVLPGAGVPDALAARKSGLFGLGMIGTVAVLGFAYWLLLRK